MTQYQVNFSDFSADKGFEDFTWYFVDKNIATQKQKKKMISLMKKIIEGIDNKKEI